MAKNDNLGDFLTDIADAIREKKGTTEPINAQDFASEIASIEGGGGASASMWTGHADVEGLKAIGWDDDDIAYFQQYGVNWNEEDDDAHKVTSDNKALHGVLTLTNISSYANRIVYLPKIDTSEVKSLNATFRNCNVLKGLPFMDTSSVTDMRYTFAGCASLGYIPPLDTSKVINMGVVFQGCYNLKCLPPLDTSKVINMTSMFNNCYSLSYIHSLDTSKVSSIGSMFNGCKSLVKIPRLNLSSASSVANIFNECNSLVNLEASGIKTSYSLPQSALLSKESLLFIINNSTASTITITLNTYAYERLANDVDILAALSNHTNISLAST